LRQQAEEEHHDKQIQISKKVGHQNEGGGMKAIIDFHWVNLLLRKDQMKMEWGWSGCE